MMAANWRPCHECSSRLSRDGWRIVREQSASRTLVHLRSRSIVLCASRLAQEISVGSFCGRFNRTAEYDAVCLESWPGFSRPPVINGRTPTRSPSRDRNPVRLV